jgi:phage tail sheath protein FI
VYIEEFSPGAPIQGVGTSTAAFLGPLGDGPIGVPTKLTTWEAFLAAYGAEPRSPQDYLWYAVRGFFQNNGQVCYILRVSNASYDFLDLLDRTGQPTLRLRARRAGNNQPRPIQATVAAANALSTTLYQVPNTTITNASGVTVQIPAAGNRARNFRPGDRVTISGGGNTESVRVLRRENNTLRLIDPLANTYNNTATIRLADLRAGLDDTFRLANGANLFPGSILTLTEGGNPPDTVVVRSVTPEQISGSLTTYRVTTAAPVTRNFNLANPVTAVSQEFNLTITQQNDNGTTYTGSYPNLSMEPTSLRYYVRIVNEDPDGRVLLEPLDPPNTSPVPDNIPNGPAGTNDLSGGLNDNPTALGQNEYDQALNRLMAFDDVNLVAAPGQTDPGIQAALITHCANMMDRFALLESPRGAPPFGANSVEALRPGWDSPSGYAAVYYPWLEVSSADGQSRLFVPPTGHVAGVIARTDNSRGVFKAPAGMGAVVSGAVGVERALSDVEQGQLNLQGINVIRVFQSGGRPVVWGARTTAPQGDTVWQYVSIRRLFLFLEESIQEGIRWAVFEPNNPALWAKLRRTIRAFLLQQWRDGALFGDTPEQAFYVRIDETLNPFDQQALGRLYIEIGARPAYPAEFIIVRIGIWDGGEEVTESV